VLAINILGDRKALYRVSEFYRDKDLETIFDEDVTVDALNDSALAHALDGKKYKSLDKVMEGVLPQGLWTSTGDGNINTLILKIITKNCHKPKKHRKCKILFPITAKRSLAFSTISPSMLANFCHTNYRFVKTLDKKPFAL
jgi:hypothetical protein